jgi:NAD+ synthase
MMKERAPFSRDVLRIDPAAETERIAHAVRDAVVTKLRRRGAVVALSGGIDSSVVGALCVRALGADRVYGLRLPERESSQETRDLSALVADHLGIASHEEDITGALEALGCYARRDAAIRRVVPSFGPGCTSKIVLPDVVDRDVLRVFSVVVRRPDGGELRMRLTPESYLEIVASTNFKQRVRKSLEYHHADRLQYAVAGTPNLLEYDQGFFVKLGDGAADFKPIAHLYKTQVYALGAHLGLPRSILSRAPTTDTYSLAQSQEEFYFSLPYDRMDLCLYARSHGYGAEEVAPVVDLPKEGVERVFRDIDSKRLTTRYLHAPPILVDRGAP